GRAGAIAEQQALEAAVVRFAHRGVHANIRGDAREDDVLNAAPPQQHVEVGAVEGTFARLVDHRLVGERCQLRDDLPARFAAREDASARAVVADARADALTSPAFV